MAVDDDDAAAAAATARWASQSQMQMPLMAAHAGRCSSSRGAPLSAAESTLAGPSMRMRVQTPAVHWSRAL